MCGIATQLLHYLSLFSSKPHVILGWEHTAMCSCDPTAGWLSVILNVLSFQHQLERRAPSQQHLRAHIVLQPNPEGSVSTGRDGNEWHSSPAWEENIKCQQIPWIQNRSRPLWVSRGALTSAEEDQWALSALSLSGLPCISHGPPHRGPCVNTEVETVSASNPESRYVSFSPCC